MNHSFFGEANQCIGNDQSILLSAKRIEVAKYVIARSLNDKQRVIYTTLTKALSNQKYHELSKEFDDVGLVSDNAMTNLMASCLIMTTEVLRNMLYHGIEFMHNVEWVLFDEIEDNLSSPYWQQTLVLFPDIVKCLFLTVATTSKQLHERIIMHLRKENCYLVHFAEEEQKNE